MTKTVIFHNPACGTSRNTLALIRDRGVEPEVIEYLKAPPTREALQALLDALHLPARDLLRSKEAIYAELSLDDPKWTDVQLLDFVVAHPVLLNRPVVVSPLGARICRPADTVLDILPKA